jgi:Domain of Unknown Function (DUF1080)/TIR domain
MNMTSIFVSYRREDSRHQAGRLFDHLVRHFGPGQVFDHFDSIPAGLDFREVLTERVAGCDVFLAVIGDAWLSITGSSETRRLDDPGDFVRIEIEAALSRKIPVIPVLVGSSSVPRAEDLPESLRGLAYRHGLPVRSDPDFHHDVERLIGGIKDVVSAPRMGTGSRGPKSHGAGGVRSAPTSPSEEPKAARTQRETDAEPRIARCRKVAEPPGAESHSERTNKYRETQSSMNAATDVAPTRRPPWMWPSVVVGVLMLGFLAAWLGGVFKVKAPDSAIVLENVPDDATAHAERWVSLFNGEDLSGWRLLGNPKQTWKVLQGGILEGSGPPAASTLTTERADFANFHLRVETKLAEGPDGAIAFRIIESNGESARYIALIAGTDQGENNTGCLRFIMPGFPATLANADPVVPIKPGEWFTEEVIADGNVITVIVKGIEVAKFKILHHKLMSGAIGLICRGNSRVVFRKIEITKLNGVGAGGSLANAGETEKGAGPVDRGRMAAIFGSGNWQIEDGDQLVQTKSSKLAGLTFGSETWTDYSLSADVKLVENGTGLGLTFRAADGKSYWYGAGTAVTSNQKASLCRWLPDADPQFSVLRTQRARDAVLTRGRWHTMKIDAIGERFTAYLDGEMAYVASDASIPHGKVGFRCEEACRIRNIKVTAPNGKTLWEGLPEIPTASAFGLSLRGGKP